jgi:hypothetical protein
MELLVLLRKSSEPPTRIGTAFEQQKRIAKQHETRRMVLKIAGGAFGDSQRRGNVT